VHNHGITDPGHAHSAPVFNTNAAGNEFGTGGVVQLGTATIGTSTTGFTINNAGSGRAMPIVNPNFGTLKIIKF
jgi:hypothetical protein